MVMDFRMEAPRRALCCALEYEASALNLTGPQAKEISPMTKPEQPARLVVETHEGIATIPRARWQRLVRDQTPFLSYGFLRTLEETGCLEPDSGWYPLVLTARREGSQDLVGALPLYLKGNSAGEFVYDWSWADAAHRAGLSYYPKGVVAAPFTPVTGARLLVAPELEGETRRAVQVALAQAAVAIGDQMGLSSVHFNFVLPEEAALLSEELQLPVRHGVQYHWYNGRREGDGKPGRERYGDFDGFLARFRSKKRANIRRERRKLADTGVTTRVVRGQEADEALLARMYRWYKSTVDKFYWGQQYLTRDFFLTAPEALGDALHLVVASDDTGRDFAGAFNLVDDHRLYGRYWGCDEEAEFTHFEVCMYTPISWCIEHDIVVFEPGQGGEHKLDRGFEPTRTYSAHYLRDPGLRHAITDHLRHDRRHTTMQLEAMIEDSPLKDPAL